MSATEKTIVGMLPKAVSELAPGPALETFLIGLLLFFLMFMPQVIAFDFQGLPSLDKEVLAYLGVLAGLLSTRPRLLVQARIGRDHRTDHRADRGRVVHDQNALAKQRARLRRRDLLLFGQVDAQGEIEGRSPARFAFDPYGAAHHVHKARRDGKAKPRSPVFPRGRGIDL